MSYNRDRQGAVPEPNNMAQRLKTDWFLFGAVLAMLCFGVLILYSASSIMAQLRFGSTWHFVVRQLAWAGAAVVVMMTLKRTHYRTFQKLSLIHI